MCLTYGNRLFEPRSRSRSHLSLQSQWSGFPPMDLEKQGRKGTMECSEFVIFLLRVASISSLSKLSGRAGKQRMHFSGYLTNKLMWDVFSLLFWNQNAPRSSWGTSWVFVRKRCNLGSKTVLSNFKPRGLQCWRLGDTGRKTSKTNLGVDWALFYPLREIFL